MSLPRKVIEQMDSRFKFRIWDNTTKKMTHLPRHFNAVMVNGTVCIVESFPNMNGFYKKRVSKEFDDAVLMQCTGLEDIAGKLIYEGDILFEDCKNEVYPNGKYWIVKWHDKHTQFYIEMINPSKYEFYPQWHLARHDLDYKIIGNIYENPELLTKDGNNERLSK